MGNNVININNLVEQNIYFIYIDEYDLYSNKERTVSLQITGETLLNLAKNKIIALSGEINSCPYRGLLYQIIKYPDGNYGFDFQSNISTNIHLACNTLSSLIGREEANDLL